MLTLTQMLTLTRLRTRVAQDDEEKVEEVLDLFKQGLNIPRISERLGKSEPTIRKAIEYAQACGLIPLQNSG